MEEKELTDLILELKSKLQSKYGDKFFKFYLCDFGNGRWEGLASVKEGKGTRSGSYFRIIEGVVEEEILNP
jgi:hypothetical protein